MNGFVDTAKILAPNNILVFLIIAALSAILTRILLRNLNYFLMDKGIFGIDINKPNKPKIPEEGGISIVIAFVFSLFLFKYFFQIQWISLIIITTILISLIGFIDRVRNIKPFPKFTYCAIVGSVYSISYLQNPNFNIIYALLFLFLGSIFYSVLVNAFNLLAGFNGLESGVTIISSMALGIFFSFKGLYGAAGVLFLMATAYFVFWQLNKYPAQIFLGDSGTLVPASVYFGLAIVTTFWLPIIIVLAPHLLNAAIKFASTGISSRSDHQPLVFKQGKLYLPEKNYCSLIRLFLLTGPKSEKAIVYYVYAIESFFCFLLILLFRH